MIPASLAPIGVRGWLQLFLNDLERLKNTLARQLAAIELDAVLVFHAAAAKNIQRRANR
jgi:hypothetical protein